MCLLHFFTPWFVQHLSWCLGALRGCRKTPPAPTVPTEEARVAGGGEEDAARRELLSMGMEGEDSEKKAGKMEIRDFSDLKERETTKP